MDLLTPELRQRLLANAAAHHEATQHGVAEPDPAPVVKFFNPCGAATWLFSELDCDGDTLFGLCDLGFGCPELGSASLAEIASVTVSFGLKIERDLHFAATHPLSAYAEAARNYREWPQRNWPRNSWTLTAVSTLPSPPLPRLAATARS